MRYFHLFLTFAVASSAFEIPFLNALALPISLEDYFPPSFSANETAKIQQQYKELRRRQNGNTCPTDFHPCSNLNAPGICCADSTVCQPDDSGNVACCPSASSCTGTINGVITSGTVNTYGSLVGGGGATGTASNQVTPVSSNSGGVRISSNTPTSPGPSASGSAFVLNGGSGSGVARRAEIPLLARAILKVLQYLPI